MTGRCPICNKVSRLSKGNPWRPFCSERCRLVDLGAWFAEDRRLPLEDETATQDRDAAMPLEADLDLAPPGFRHLP